MNVYQTPEWKRLRKANIGISNKIAKLNDEIDRLIAKREANVRAFQIAIAKRGDR